MHIQPSILFLYHSFCLVIVFLLYVCFFAHPPPSFSLPPSCLRSRTRWQQLQILGAAGAGGPGDPGEGLLVGGGQVDHEEDAVRHVLLRAAAGKLTPATTEGGEQLAVLLGVLQVLQGDHVGQVQLVEVKALPAPTDHEAEGTEDEEEEGGSCYGNERDGYRAVDGLS